MDGPPICPIGMSAGDQLTSRAVADLDLLCCVLRTRRLTVAMHTTTVNDPNQGKPVEE